MPGEPSRKLEMNPGDVLSAQALDGRSVYFEVSRKVGSGGEGVVYEAIADDGQVAVVKGPLMAGTRDLSLEREARYLAEVNPHPNVIRFLAAQKDPRGHTLIFLERAFDNPLRVLNRADVKARLAGRQAQGKKISGSIPTRPRMTAPPLSIGLELGYDLARGIERLHEKGLIHGDIKLSNLMIAIDWPEPSIPDRAYFERLVKGRWQGVLIDMGGVRTAKELDALMRGLPVVKPPKMTAAYAPPEVLPGLIDSAGNERSRFSMAMDVYAFGLVLYQLATGWLPYGHLRQPPDDHDLQLVARTKRDERDGAHRPITRAALDAIDWSDCTIASAKPSPSDRDAFLEELWALLARTTHVDAPQRGRMPEVRAALGKLLHVEEVTLDEARAIRDCADEPDRTVRPWVQNRLRLDTFSSRLADAGRDGLTEKHDPRARKIQRRGSDFWDMQGLGGNSGGKS